MLIYLTLAVAAAGGRGSNSIVMVRNIILGESGTLDWDLLQGTECFGSNDKT